MSSPDLEALIEAAVAGDDAAWQRMWRAVEPALYSILRQSKGLGRLAQSEDDCRNIVLEVMGRLRADGFARLRQYLQARRQNPTLPFMGWLVVVARRVAIDDLRAHELMVFAEAELPPEQRAALVAWLGGASFDEIASDARQAERLVRAALVRLRRRFRATLP